MSNLSDLLPSGAGGKSFDFVASGTLASGQTIALRSDGKVEAAAASGGDPSAGSASVFNSGNSEYVGACYDASNNKVVIFYTDVANNYYGTAVVGTVAGTSVSFGSEVVFNSGNTFYFAPVFDPDSNKVVCLFRDDTLSSKPQAIVGTVSGTSISFGSKTEIGSSAEAYNAIAYDTASNRFIFAYKISSNLYIRTGTISGTTIGGLGTQATVTTALTNFYQPMVVQHDPDANRVQVLYCNNNTNGGAIRISAIDGSGNFSFGSEIVVTANDFSYPAICYDTANNKAVLAYKNGSSSGAGTALVGTSDGSNGMAFGSAVTFETGIANYITAVFDTANNKVVFSYVNGSNSNQPTSIVGTVSGTSISFSTAVQLAVAAATTGTQYTYSTFDSTTNQVIVAYRDQGNSNYGMANVFNASPSNVTSFVGITEAAISNAATGTVTLQGGINTTAITNTATTTFAITVANPGSGNRYYIDGALQATVSLSEGRTYKFDQSNGTNGGHPLRFSTTSNGTHGGGTEYTTGVTVVGVPGNAGAYTQIVVAIGAPTLYYYCTAHSGMGGTANTPDDARFTVGSTYYVQDDGTLGTGSTSIVAGEALSATSINLVNT